ncbi:MAG: threonine--tRNA ligase [Candidatus Absconditabacterales bacterium]
MADQLYCIRHSLAHMLAQAVQRTLDPHVQLGTGPAIDDGFYYDMKFSEGVVFKEEELKELGKAVEKCVKEGQSFGHYQCKDYEEAVAIASIMKQDFKKDLLKKFHDAGETSYTFYYNTISTAAKDKLLAGVRPDYLSYYDEINKGLAQYDTTLPSSGQYIVFIDLCEGGHVQNTKEIPDGSFAMNKIAGAYRQGKEGNPMMTRIYGRSFETKDNLKSHLTMLEEAKKRDHRVIGQKMKLFTISEKVGSGLPLFQPNGMLLRREVTEYLWELHKDKGYLWVCTPHIAKEDLYNTSGHAKHYLDDMFKVHGGTSNEDFYLKPMNCPHHMEIFKDNQFSYRDMPIRYFEPTTVYRDEKPGQLAGLTRVRSITQDDGHLFCRMSQIAEEAKTVVGTIKQFYETLGMFDGYRVSLSVRGEDRSQYLGTDEQRELAEKILKDVCIDLKLNYKEMPGEAAFYGPKLDFMFRDAIGRYHQLGTCQCDFNLPDRFQLEYTNEQGEKERPVVIHRAVSGSLERFIGVMVEQFAGDFPLRLAPEQIRIVPVADAFSDYAHIVQKQMQAAGLRAKVDDSDDSFSKKVRNAEVEKAYYVAIVGEKEVNDKAVSIRNVRTKEQYTANVHEFIKQAVELYKSRKLP